jgi:hypothetical protein
MRRTGFILLMLVCFFLPDRFGRRIFVWLNERHDRDHDTGGDGHIPHFGGAHIDLRRCFDRRSFGSTVPEPMAAVVFGIGAVMVGAAVRRR